MTSKRTSFPRGRVGSLLLALVASILLGACGTATDRTDNATDFRERLADSDLEVVFLPEREGRPDLVEGVVTSEDGIRSQFAFAFGPAPDRDLPAPASSADSVWFEGGDEVYYWMDYAEPRSKAERESYYDAVFAVEDTACQVVADRDCR